MIRIRYYPIRFEQKDKREFKLDYAQGKALSFYLDATGLPYKECDVILEGRLITDFTEVVVDGVDIIITIKIKFVAIGAILYAIFWTYLPVTLLVASLAASVIMALTARKVAQPSFGKTGDDLENSPTYGWEGMQTTQDVGIPIPIVYGRHAVPGNKLNEYIWTDGDKNYLNCLLGLSEGEIDAVESLHINDNPSANFDGITTEYRYGTNTQSVISNFKDLHDINSVAASLVKNNPYVYTTTLTDVEGFELHFSFPAGLYTQNSSTGALESNKAIIKIEYKLNSASYYTLATDLNIDGRSRTALRRVYVKSGLPAGKYDIRVTKISADSTTYTATDILFDSVDEVRTDDMAYPCVALASIKALATEQLSGSSPNFRVTIRGIKISIPDIRTAPAGGGTSVDWENYYWDPDTSKWKLFSTGAEVYWDGTTYITKWGANPIWCLRDLLTNARYGLGNYIATTDVDDVVNLEMAKYCEERVSDGAGGWEKRFRLDVVIDSSGKALDIISQLCTSFRGVILYAGGNAKIKIEKAEDPVQLFGMGNIAPDSYSEVWKSKRDSYNMIEVRYTDASKGYKDESIVVLDQAAIAAGEPQRKKSVRIFVTKASYAIREGNFILRACLNLDRLITFRANMSAIACMAFDVISFSHDVPQIGFSGMIKSGSTVSSVNLDREVIIEIGKTYRLLVYFANDTYEERTVTNAPGSTTSAITVSVPFTSAPLKYDKYSFGEINKVKKDYRITSLRRESNYEVSITALEYNEAIYTEGDLILPTDNYSALTVEAPAVIDLNLTEGLIKLRDGTIESVIDVWFSKPSLSGYYVGSYIKAKIYLSDDAGDSWQFRGETTGTHFQILGGISDLNQYTVCVTSVSTAGKEKSIVNSPFAVITIAGKSAPPADVESFIVTQDKDRLRMGWPLVSDVDIMGYEIRLGTDWISADEIAFVQGNTYLTTILKVGANQSYWIKAVDTSGNYSLNATEAVISINSIPYKNVVTTYTEEAAWAGDKSGHLDLVNRITVYKDSSTDLINKVTVLNKSTKNLVCHVTVVFLDENNLPCKLEVRDVYQSNLRCQVFVYGSRVTLLPCKITVV
jgi:predicted phage tail protein